MSGNWKGPELAMHQKLAAGSRGGRASKCDVVQCHPFSDVCAQEGSDHRRGWD